MSQSALLAKLRQQNADLDEKLEIKRLLKAIKEKTRELEDHKEEKEPERKEPPPQQKHERLTLAETDKKELKNANGEVKFVNKTYTANNFTLTKGANVSQIANRVLDLSLKRDRGNRDMKNVQIRLVFESNAVATTHTDLIFIMKKGEVGHLKIMAKLNLLIANKIASSSEGQWVLKHVEVKGTF